MNAQELLEQAADMVEAGWCRGSLSTAEGGVCALGAILRVGVGHVTEIIRAETALGREIRTGTSIPEWNDYIAWDSYDVSDAMRRAAKTLANEAQT